MEIKFAVYTSRQYRREVFYKDLAGKKSVVFYFFPKDRTIGSAKEACVLLDIKADFEEAELSPPGMPG